MFASIKAFVIIVLIFNVLIRADQFGKEPAYCNEDYVLRRRLGSTDRNISVERSLLDWHFPNFVTTLTELELHKHQDHGSLKYFELGVGNGIEILQLKALFPCINMRGINTMWHCASFEGANCDSSDDALMSMVTKYSIRGINPKHNIPHIFIGDASKDGLDILEENSIDYFTSMNMFHYITSPHLKVKVLNKALTSLSTNGILYMYWNWLAATIEKIDFFGNYEGEKEFGILRGITGQYKGSPIRICLFFSKDPGIFLWVARGNTFYSDPEEGKYHGIPEKYFNNVAIDHKKIAEYEAIVQKDIKNSKKGWHEVLPIIKWMESFM